MRKLLASFVFVVVGLGGAGTAMANDGDLDTSWGGTGVVRLGLSDYDFVDGVSPHGSSGVQVVGNIDSSGGGGLYDATALMRFTADGNPDPSCNGTGHTLLTAPDGYISSDIAVLDDGSTLVAGTLESTPPWGFIAKFTPTCQLDPTFGVGGIVSYTNRDGVNFSSLVVQSNGFIVVGGLQYFAPADGGDSRFAVARFSPTGGPDLTFGPLDDGVYVSDFSHEGRVTDVDLDSLGRVLFVGVQNQVGGDDAVVARLTNLGELDPSYASSGWFTRGGIDDQRFYSLAPRSGGGVIAVGGDEGLGFHATMMCLDSNGNVDSMCGVNGVASQVTLPAGAADAMFWSVVIDDVGRYVISGWYDDPTVSGSGISPFVVRLLTNSSPDPTFGSGGLVSVPFVPGHATHVALDQRGRILVGGHEFTPNGIHAPIVRLTASTTTSTTTTVAAPTTVSPQLLPATGKDAPGTWAVVVMALGLGLLLVRRYAVVHSAK